MPSQPPALIIVGAGIGPAPETVAAFSEVVLVEPHPELSEELRDFAAEHSTWQVIEGALTPQAGQTVVHLCTPPGFSSTAVPLPALSKRFPGVARGAPHPTTGYTLPGVCACVAGDAPITLWLDAGELLPVVLQAWPECPRISDIWVTVPQVPIYEGALDLSELHAHAEQNFLAIEVVETPPDGAQRLRLREDHTRRLAAAQAAAEQGARAAEARAQEAIAAADTANAALQTAQDHIATLTAETAALGTELTALKTTNAELKAKLTEADAKVADLTNQLSALSSEDLDRVEILRMQHENIQALSEVAALKSALDRLHHIEREADTVIGAVKDREAARFRSAQASLQKLMQERDALVKKVEKLRRKLGKREEKHKAKG